MPRRTLVTIAFGLACHGLSACNGTTTPTPTATSLSIACDSTALTAIGQQAHCAARAAMSNNQTEDRTPAAQWSTSDPSKASVAGGVVTAVSAGSAVITATVTGLTAQQTITVSAGCTFSLSPSSASFGASGGSQVVTVNASPAGCAPASWTAASNSAGLSVSPTSGSGGGTVTVTVAPNSGGAQASTATIAGQTFTANIGGACTYSFQPLALDAPGAWNVSGAINERTVNVTVGGSSCASWLAEPSAGWISVSPSSGTESTAVHVFAAANDGAPRTGSVTFRSSQCATPCASAVTITINQTFATATLSLTLTQGEQLTGPYSGFVTGPNGFNCTLGFSDNTVKCPPLTAPSGVPVTLVVALINPATSGLTPIRTALGCDSLTRSACTVLMNGDRSVTIAIGCEIACGEPFPLATAVRPTAGRDWFEATLFRRPSTARPGPAGHDL